VNHHAGWQGESYVLEISGEVHQARLFGENLTLRRRILTQLGSNKIQLEDVVTNEGFAPQPHMILYHFNAGFPLLSPDASLQVEVSETAPRDAEAEKGLADWMRFQPPTPAYSEQVFHHTPVADSDGRVQINLHNPVLGLSLRWTYQKETLPHLFQWKMMGQGAYVLGIEPANCAGMHGRAAARESGDLPYLAPGESCRYELALEVFE
jgi:hypothetical protein